MPSPARPASSSTAHAGVNQRVLVPLILGALALLVLLHAFSWTRLPLARVERHVLDTFHVRGEKNPTRADVVVLAIDDDSLSRAHAWEDDIAASPALQAMAGRFTNWPRRVWAMTLDRLFEAGASQVFLDLLFFGSTTPEDDQALADALRRHKGKVVIGAKFNLSDVFAIEYPGAAISGSEIPEDGTWGYINFWPDGDGTIRHARYHTTRWKVEKEMVKDSVPDPTDPTVPSISLSLAKRVNVSASANAPEWARMRFCEANAYQPVSLHQIFVPGYWENNFGKGESFKNKIVLVGATAPILHDFFQTPLGEMPGVNIHAHALTALLAQSFLKDVPGSWLWLSLVLGAFIAWLMVTTVRQPVLCFLAMWLLTAGVVWLCFEAFNRFNVEASPLSFAYALNGCGILGLTGNFLSQLRQSRKLSRFIQRYHSPDRVAHLLKDRANLFSTLGGIERAVTILFSDVRGFTTMSESMKPEQLVTQLNEYLSRMVEKVFINAGSIDKFIGDAVMALWGSMPQPGVAGNGLKDDALNAVTSAVAMRDVLAELNAGWKSRGMQEWAIGIGIHQGNVIVANVGSAHPYERMELTVIGDNVNLSSRLEGTTKEYGVDIIISDVVHNHVKEMFLCRSADLVRVKGKAQPVEVFTVLGHRKTTPEPPGLAEFEQGVAHYRAGRFQESIEAFDLAAAAGLKDVLTDVYRERCELLMLTPPEKWDGVYVMKKK